MPGPVILRMNLRVKLPIGYSHIHLTGVVFWANFAHLYGYSWTLTKTVTSIDNLIAPVERTQNSDTRAVKSLDQK